MYVALVGDVETEAVLGRIKDAVEADSEFNYAEVRADVAAVLGGCLNDSISDLLSELRERGT